MIGHRLECVGNSDSNLCISGHRWQADSCWDPDQMCCSLQNKQINHLVTRCTPTAHVQHLPGWYVQWHKWQEWHLSDRLAVGDKVLEADIRHSNYAFLFVFQFEWNSWFQPKPDIPHLTWVSENVKILNQNILGLWHINRPISAWKHGSVEEHFIYCPDNGATWGRSIPAGKGDTWWWYWGRRGICEKCE